MVHRLESHPDSIVSNMQETAHKVPKPALMRRKRHIKRNQKMRKTYPVELKIKAKHLAFEPAIIKHEEKKLARFSEGWYIRDGDPIRKKKTDAMIKAASLHEHRIMKLKVEARGTELARAFLAGKPYLSVEAKRKPEREYEFSKAVQRAKKIASNYGPVTDLQQCSDLFDKWLNGDIIITSK